MFLCFARRVIGAKRVWGLAFKLCLNSQTLNSEPSTLLNPDWGESRLVQDFVANETPKMWLDRVLDAQPQDSPERTSLRDIFESTHCVPLFLPATSRAALRALDQIREADLTPEYVEVSGNHMRRVRVCACAAGDASTGPDRQWFCCWTVSQSTIGIFSIGQAMRVLATCWL